MDKLPYVVIRYQIATVVYISCCGGQRYLACFYFGTFKTSKIPIQKKSWTELLLNKRYLHYKKQMLCHTVLAVLVLKHLHKQAYIKQESSHQNQCIYGRNVISENVFHSVFLWRACAISRQEGQSEGKLFTSYSIVEGVVLLDRYQLKPSIWLDLHYT